MLTCDVLEGHLSSTLPHLGNISYRSAASCMFDGKSETFVDDKEADRLLTREYRKGFEVLAHEIRPEVARSRSCSRRSRVRCAGGRACEPTVALRSP